MAVFKAGNHGLAQPADAIGTSVTIDGRIYTVRGVERHAVHRDDWRDSPIGLLVDPGTGLPPTSFAHTFRSMAETLSDVPALLDHHEETQEAGAVNRVIGHLRDVAQALEVYDADPDADGEEMPRVLGALARMVRDRDRDLANHSDWLFLGRREVGTPSPDTGEVFIRIQPLVMCPKCYAAVEEPRRYGHAAWHRKEAA